MNLSQSTVYVYDTQTEAEEAIHSLHRERPAIPPWIGEIDR